MKLLCVIDINPRTSPLLRTLEGLCQVGFAQEFVEKDVEQFNPDCIISFRPLQTGRKYHLFGNIPPYIDYDAYKRSLSAETKFKSDVTLIGNLKELGQDAHKILQEFDFACFDTSPNMTPYYNGYIAPHEVFTIYRNSRVSLIPQNDYGFRRLEIIASQSVPVGLGHEIRHNIRLGLTKRPEGSESVLNEHTNYDVMAKKIRGFGLSDLAGQIRNKK